MTRPHEMDLASVPDVALKTIPAISATATMAVFLQTHMTLLHIVRQSQREMTPDFDAKECTPMSDRLDKALLAIFVTTMLIGCGSERQSTPGELTAKNHSRDESRLANAAIDRTPERPMFAESPKASAHTIAESHDSSIVNRQHNSQSGSDQAASATASANERSASPKSSIEWLAGQLMTARKAADQLVQATGEPPIEPKAVQEFRRLQDEIIHVARQLLVKSAPGAVPKHPEQNSFFLTAAEEMGHARMQLALLGDDSQYQQMADDAATLKSQHPQSQAAVESAFAMVELTQRQAQTDAAKDSKWATAYARQSRTFATHFPQDSNRAAIHVLSAGRICDQLGLESEARACFILIAQNYPDTPFADQIQNSLRRLTLVGQLLTDFGGSTIDGDFVSIESYRGSPVVVAFWSAESLVYDDDRKLIRDTIKEFGGDVQVLGVNLDSDPALVQSFVAVNDDESQHIFFSEQTKRGADHPLARYYDVRKVPTYWLVDASGVVRTVHLRPQDLRTYLGRLEFAKSSESLIR